MKVAVITSYYANNYGAMLQTYALQRVLIDKFGQDAVALAFYPPWYKVSWQLFEHSFSKGAILRNIRKLLHPRILMATARRFKRCKAFVANNIRSTEQKYYSPEELRKNPPKCDCFICGSDQIWNTKLRIMPAFFMDYTIGLKQVRKFSYAPSVLEPIVPEAEEFVRECLANLDLISVRETPDIEKLRKYTDKPIERMVDPVFLQSSEEWGKFAPDSLYDKPYLLCYMIGYESVAAPMIEKIRKLLNLDVVVVGASNTKIRADRIITEADPRDFVSLIRNASFVCTNSFHCTAFSTILEKDFYIVGPNEKRKARMENVLSDFELGNRFLTADAAEKLTAESVKIDYTKKRERMSELQERSYDYIKRGLGL